jgi:hypothetical protein
MSAGKTEVMIRRGGLLVSRRHRAMRPRYRWPPPHRQ